MVDKANELNSFGKTLVILVRKIQMHEIVCQYMLTLILQQFSPRFSI